MSTILALGLLISCKPDTPNPPSGSSDLTKDSLILTTSGAHELKLDFDASAKITLIGGGGGGGGGIKHSEIKTDLTTGGAGGGGAGDIKEFNDVDIKAGVTYVIFVGKAGSGGILGANGTNGGNSTITDNDGFFKVANGGGLGRSGPDDSYVGGVGGTGYPGGDAGQVGISSGAGADEDFAKGGGGGKNGSAYGNGGGGGQGSSKSGGAIVQGGNGQGGQVGYVKIVYEEKE